MSSRLVVRLAVFGGVLVAGALVARLGTRDEAMNNESMGDEAMPSMPIDELCLPPDAIQRALSEGAAIHEQSCAGCHDRTATGIGPAYRVVVDAYRRTAGTGVVEGRILAGLARASTHPGGGFPSFAPPTTRPVLSVEQQDALAYWLWRGAPGVGTVDALAREGDR